MTFLRPPAWAEDRPSTGTAEAAGAASSSSPAPTPPILTELLQSLISQRQRREVALRLREALRDVRAEFSFARVKGLRRVLKFLSAAVASDKGVELFRESQQFQELQVVPSLFRHTLAPQKSPPSLVPAFDISCNEPTALASTSTPAEIVLALRVLEGCCLLDSSSKLLAAEHMAVKELVELLSASGPERSACLDALLALMLDCPVNQKEFDYYRGMYKVAESVKNRHVDVTLRMKFAEFLLLVGDVLAKDEQIEQEVRQILGSECSSLILDVYSKLDLADPEEKRRTLNSFAERVLAAVDR